MLTPPAVKPQLRFDNWHYRGLQGMVNTSFANAQYIEANCKTPIIPSMDPEYSKNSCLDVVEFASKSYYDYGRYISAWSTFANTTEGSIDLNNRPRGVGQFNEATDVNAAWVEISNVTEDSLAFGRSVNNVSLAMPHAGLVQAAQDPINGILQPNVGRTCEQVADLDITDNSIRTSTDLVSTKSERRYHLPW